MSGLPWVRFDTSLPDSPKVLDLLGHAARGKGAGFVFVCSILYSGKHGTDGFIPTAALPRINGDPDDAALLVDAELWTAVPGGWQIPNWTEYQQSAESNARVRAAKKAGSAKGNCIRWHGPDCGCWNTGTDTDTPPGTGPVRLVQVRRGS